MVLAEPIAVALEVAAVLERLGVRFGLGGSVASSVYGVPRSTHDVDLVAELERQHVAPLVDALALHFHVDADLVREAVERGSSFNAIHLATMMKVDVFVSTGSAFHRRELARLRSITVEGRVLPVVSPEDIVVEKLRWFRLGGGASERQWRDAVAVLRVQGPRLDASYLREWAAALGVPDDLERALAEAADNDS